MIQLNGLPLVIQVGNPACFTDSIVIIGGWLVVIATFP